MWYSSTGAREGVWVQADIDARTLSTKDPECRKNTTSKGGVSRALLSRGLHAACAMPMGSAMADALCALARLDIQDSAVSALNLCSRVRY